MRLLRAEAEGGASGAQGEHSHPTWKFYVLIGVILTVITAAEVAVFYIPALRPVLIPLLLVLSGTKFALVVMFFMHLKFDNPIFSGVFVAPLILASFVVVALIVLFHVFPHGAA
jgi:cytochrome c oxidase subunit 4